MGVATGNMWKGSYTGAALDGVDMWNAIMGNSDSPRSEIVHYVDKFGNTSIQIDMHKLILTSEGEASGYSVPKFPVLGSSSSASCLSV